jgi:hypothetical protein
MKKTLAIFALLSIVGLLAVAGSAQSRTNRITRPCAGSATFGRVEVQADGDIDLVPCVGRSVLINGVATSNTLTVSGSSRTNFFPYFSTETNLAKSPFGWNGTAFSWNNTALNATFGLNFTPDTSNGNFSVGESGVAFFELSQNGFAAFVVGAFDISPTSGQASLSLGSSSNAMIRGGTRASAVFDGSTLTASLGDAQVNGNVTVFSVNDSTGTFAFTKTANDAIASFAGVANFQFQRTITAGGTTGNRTINLPAGTVNFAAGTGTAGITVTNSTVTATSIVMAIARTNDTTCSVKNVVPAAGSAETSVGFLVLN